MCGSVASRAAPQPSVRAPPARLAASLARPSGVTLRGVFITFLSDFGLKDDFVGTCHGVIKRIAPEAQIIDITHGIPPTSILQGALVLANTIGFMPVGVHLAIVDPGVGGPRRPLALRDAEGRVYVGPDNGLLLPAASRSGIEAAHELANPEYALDSISRTFHGRDLFSPAAAHLAHGRSARGARSARRSGGTRSPRLPEHVGGRWSDHGDAPVRRQLRQHRAQSHRDDVEALGIVSGTRVELELAGERYYAMMARTFADARPGDVILYEDSYKNMSLAISRGSAARMLHASPGQGIRITIAGLTATRDRAAALGPRPRRFDLRGKAEQQRISRGRADRLDADRNAGRRSSAAGATSPAVQ